MLGFLPSPQPTAEMLDTEWVVPVVLFLSHRDFPQRFSLQAQLQRDMLGNTQHQGAGIHESLEADR